ncbi:N-acetyltransferase [uncultured Reyranella sp.]|uniref:GNAT family N-acetyltransferase n=1 Tax=uncultured Reyranella sp. TaxID=735512 RepID=UPI0025FA2105|nr:N-acetyltransferase [uncultured Reyranella sp.]
MAGPGSGHDVVIREREPADDEAIRRLNDLAFGSPFEGKLIEELREAFIDAVELVAVEDGAIVGHILFSALTTMVDDDAVPTLSLAPMCVHPDHQNAGIGSALVETGLDLARRREWQAVVVLGHPGFYPRFGFSAELASGLDAPFEGDSFMALELVPGALDGDDGLIVYPTAFGLVS